MYLLEHFPAIVKVAEKKVVKLVRPVEIFIPKDKAGEIAKDPFETFKPIQFFSPTKAEKPTTSITMKQGTVRVAQDFQVDILDPTNFLNQHTEVIKTNVVQFKKNTGARKQ